LPVGIRAVVDDRRVSSQRRVRRQVLFRVKDIVGFRLFGNAQVSRIFKAILLTPATLGSYDNNTVGTPRTIDCSRRCVLEDIDALYIIGVKKVEGILG